MDGQTDMVLSLSGAVWLAILLMIIWGTLATQSDEDATDPRWAWLSASAGIALALGVFMTDAWRALPGGRDAMLQVLPTTFNWPLFGVAWLLMSVPALEQLGVLPTKKPQPWRLRLFISDRNCRD